jgi:hypothetical protein
MRRLYTDRRSDCEAPDGTVTAETEVDFLQAVAGDRDLVVRGEFLCRWAVSVWRGRGLPIVRLLSPVEELEECAVGSEPGQLAQLYEEHASALSTVARPFRLQRVLEALYPEDVMWRSHPDLRHAASWLLWLDQSDPPATVQPLLRTQAMLWRATSKGLEAVLYDAYDPEKARELLSNWLGYGEQSMAGGFPTFPLDVPTRHLDMAARRWRPRIVTTKAGCVRDLVKQTLPRRLREKAAKLAYDYYKANQGHLSQDAISLLSGHLPPQSTAALRVLLPPPTPGMPPTDTPALKRWFRDDYLPYRMWCLMSKDKDGLVHCVEASKAFAKWYLDFYPQAIAAGNPDLAFVRSSKARATGGDAVTLFVIADGLCEPDAETMVREMVTRDTRLTVSRRELAFASVPTVTEVCKPALKMGRAPRDVATANPLPANVHVLPENQDPSSELGKAKVGDFFIWSHPEPDRTYHGSADAATLVEKVGGEVRALASRVVKAAGHVPAHLKLRVIVATDHGRLQGRSPRSVEVPEGMEPHQRVALGPIAGVAAAGFRISDDEETVLLDGRRFGFSDDRDCAVVLPDRSFLTKDGKSGTERFPHGGLAPEEVLTPWCEINRDAEPPSVEFTAIGTAEGGKAGQVSIRCVNAGDIDLVVLSVELQFRDRPQVEIICNEDLPSQDEKRVTRAISPWPTPTDLRAATAVARVRLPVGDEQSVPVQLEMQSEGFQSRDDILGDLL